MTENQYTSKLLARTRALLPGCHAIKHADYATGGVPDFTVSWQGETVWCEAKIWPKPLTAIQRRTLEHLDMATNGKTYVVYYTPFKTGVQVKVFNCKGGFLASGNYDTLARVLKARFS